MPFDRDARRGGQCGVVGRPRGWRGPPGCASRKYATPPSTTAAIAIDHERRRSMIRTGPMDTMSGSSVTMRSGPAPKKNWNVYCRSPSTDRSSRSSAGSCPTPRRRSGCQMPGVLQPAGGRAERDRDDAGQDQRQPDESACRCTRGCRRASPARRARSCSGRSCRRSARARRARARAAMPKTRPLTVSWATRAAVTPDPVRAGSRRDAPRRPSVAGRRRVAGLVARVAASAAGAERRAGTARPPTHPSATVTVRGLLPGSRRRLAGGERRDVERDRVLARPR